MDGWKMKFGLLSGSFAVSFRECSSGWWFQIFFLLFTPKLGGKQSNLTCTYFSDGVGSTTNFGVTPVLHIPKRDVLTSMTVPWKTGQWSILIPVAWKPGGRKMGSPKFMNPQKLACFLFFFGGGEPWRNKNSSWPPFFIQQNYITSFGKQWFVSLGGIAREISRHDSFVVVDAFLWTKVFGLINVHWGYRIVSWGCVNELLFDLFETLKHRGWLKLDFLSAFWQVLLLMVQKSFNLKSCAHRSCRR